MPSRRSHTNSHHGCTECRAGRVKCDETKPRCSRCQAKGRTCTYRHLQSDYNPFRTVTIPKKPLFIRPYPKVTTVDCSKDAAQKAPVADPSKQKPVDGSAIALYEHYLQAISPMLTTLCSRHEILPIWDEGVRRYAATSNHLHAIVLAISAVHLALTHPNEHDRKQYLTLALEHQTQALNLFYPVLSNPTAETYGSGLVCAAFVVTCGLAVPLAARKLQPGPFDVREELTRALHLFAGITQFFKMSFREVLPISAEVRDRVLGFRQRELPDEDAERAIDEVIEHVKAQEGLVANALYLHATMHMKNVFRRLAADPGNQSVVLLWPSAIWHGSFLQRLEAREPLALVLVAYWAVCMHRVRRFFWAGDWGVWAIEAIHNTLDERWHKYLTWPMAQVGLPSQPTKTEQAMEID